MNARVLLTGALGFIGRHCAATLRSRGYEVIGSTSRMRLDAIEICSRLETADLTDSAAARALVTRVRPDFLIHLAWPTTPGRFWADPQNLRWLAAGVALFDAFGESGGRRALGVGSCSEYATRDEPCIEGQTPLLPLTVYASAKISLWYGLEAARRTYGFTAAWARVFAPYGPGEPRAKLLSATAAALLCGERASVSDGLQYRDFMFVTDVADALVAILESNAEGPINVGSGEAVQLRDVIARLAGQCGGESRVGYGERPRPPYDPDYLVADVRRLRDEVGFVPRVGLDEGLRRLVDACRAGTAGAGGVARANGDPCQEKR
jgi:nucleoside-diphosphate-sugar epimerase